MLSMARSFDSYAIEVTLKVRGRKMIRLSRLNGKEFFLNCEMIKVLEATPDTVITLVSGEKLMVKESVDNVVQATLAYKKEAFRNLFVGAPPLVDQKETTSS